MSEKIVQLNEEIIKSELKELVRGSVEGTLPRTNSLIWPYYNKFGQESRAASPAFSPSRA